jgi:uncharacterized protein (TIGR03083 family)
VSTGSQLLLVEAEALPPVLAAASAEQFDLPTVCTGWSVRDVLAHCASALSNFVEGVSSTYSPEDNQRDVDLRSSWPVERVIEELLAGYAAAAVVIADAGGAADGLALGEWIHGGDVREPLGARDAYASAGVELAIPLIRERSVQRSAAAVEVLVDGQEVSFGSGAPIGALVTDAATFVRLVAGRRPDPARYELQGAVTPQHMVLFT